MAKLKKFLPLVLGVALQGVFPAFAKPAFLASDIEGTGAEIFFSDLDGDNLKDAVVIDKLNVSIFYQDSKQGFPRKPQQQFLLDDRPAVLWSARLGQNAESLLLMTSEGVTELSFTNRTGPPARRQIIQQRTIIPDALDEPQAMHFPLSAETGTNWPLLLVPVAGGLQVWQHRETWTQIQLIENAVDTHVRAAVTNGGYDQTFALNLSLDDVNHDKREDLMLMHNVAGGMQRYALYFQNAEGSFTAQPLVYTNKADWHYSLCWVDINHDGKLDLLKSTVLDDTSFVPGMRSGKVLVAAYLADEHGQIPAEPQQVFRKNDWAPTLPAVDVDGDGFTDLILGYIPINTREGFRKMLTAEEMDLNLKFYFFRPGSGFPKEPDSQRDLLIHFGSEFFFSSEQRLYYERFLSFNGDFNGDGKKDLLARDRKDGISVYFFASREKGFNAEPDIKFHCPEAIDWWEIKDLNGDGVSDLIVKFQKRNAFRIFTSQEK